ncbi:MAG: hypothetical protein M3Y03_06525, partial [Verrucomicrobiota bacterium]|nr:hypothetical protein [Verrucomicrobiota bacterium]
PVTITTTLTGRGNFDRVSAPMLENESGWHTYPPSSSFKQDDDVGISGMKTFESVVSAKEEKRKLPAMVFSYFDPVKERYTTLRSEEVPVEIAGGAAPPADAAVASSTATPPPTAAPTPSQPVDGILPQLDDRTAQRSSFTPLYRTRAFWLAQLVPLIGLLGLAGVKWREARRNDREAQRVARLQKESTDLQRKMRREETTPQEYMAQAARAVQLKTALATNVNPNVVDLEIATAAFRLDDAERARLQQLFERSDELRYSGGRNGGDSLPAEQRREILELVENLHA